MHCHLLIPALFPPSALTRENDPLHGAKASALQTLLARGICTQTPANDMEGWLCETFGVVRQQDYPVAPFSAMADGIDAKIGYWLCADPIHLAVERDQLILTESSTFALSHSESENLITTLNQHFSADGLHFCASHPLRWYLKLEQTPAISTQSLYQVAGHNIHTHLPRGPEELRWRALINEVQMLLFEHPVNVARENRGEAPINSVWPWGGGTLPPASSQPFDQVWANDALATGLAVAGNTPHQALPAKAQEWLAQARQGNHLLVLDSLRPAACYGTPHAWRERLEKLEQQWFAPLEQALQKGAIELTLHAPAPYCTQSFAVTRSSLWKLWRRQHSLIHYRPKDAEA
ncbi:MAG: phosphoglycerate mutase [Gammaproteobacteria bacterium]|nr:phosphoglycerate mutase [Gammaproteobacteria bacterium]MBU1732666.1 phosphoglycerate mutase [Gammaproteobacteria bacterium]MBU1891940.1 phosphoglycerate mutase [Gammaproteobacteria bacterium]